MRKQIKIVASMVLSGSLALAIVGSACAQEGGSAATPAGAAAKTAAKKNAPHAKAPAKPKPASTNSSAAYEIIACGDAAGRIHKCIRIDPAAGEINDTAKGASYRVIYGQ